MSEDQLAEVRVLVVEDNPADVGLIRKSLQDHGIGSHVSVISDGERAIEYFEHVEAGTAPCPALVVLDLNLPRRTGFDVLERIRTGPLCALLPVAVFSSSDAQRDRQAAAKLGADIYIRKPSDLDEFLAIGRELKALLQAPRA